MTFFLRKQPGLNKAGVSRVSVKYVAISLMSLLGSPWWMGFESANAGSKFLETMGTSIVIGTALGASTLPFYEQPLEHKNNILLGAAGGALVGLGWYMFDVWTGEAGEEKYYFNEVQDSTRKKFDDRLDLKRLHSDSQMRGTSAERPETVKVSKWVAWFPIVSFGL